MSIDFTPERWEKVRQDAGAWWAGELDRPLIQFAVPKEPDRPLPETPIRHSTGFYDLSVPAEDIVDVWDYKLSCQKFMGDAFPFFWPDFGPGIVGAFVGARVDRSDEAGTIWFHPTADADIRDIHFTFDPENVWLRRLIDLYKAAGERWQGKVMLSMTDLGGNLDILSTFRPGEKLLYDLYDHPDEVERLLWEAHEAWWQAFHYIDAVLREANNSGCTAWAPLFSRTPYYTLQCDFCYMIGPEMFDRFAKPELAATCRRLGHSLYHLDGVGQLPHLDSLLDIPELDAIQWVPGAGLAGTGEWPEVYRRIRDGGKLIQEFGSFSDLDGIVDALGTGKGLAFVGWSDSAEQAADCLRRYGGD